MLAQAESVAADHGFPTSPPDDTVEVATQRQAPAEAEADDEARDEDAPSASTRTDACADPTLAVASVSARSR